MTCVVSAVLGVMATTPAVQFVRAARECVVAVLVAAIGAMATIGFDPVVSVVRFEYVTLGLAMVGAFGVVYRLGAGLHGLGRRGLVVVAIGGVLLAVTLLYAEMLRRYGSPGPGRPPARRRPLEPRPPRCLPAPDRDRPRRPGPGLGLPHARPPPAGLVAVRLRRRRHRAGRQRPGQPGHLAARVRPLGALRPGRRPGDRLRRHPGRPGPHRLPRARAAAGSRRPARSGRSRRAPPRCSDASGGTRFGAWPGSACPRSSRRWWPTC